MLPNLSQLPPSQMGLMDPISAACWAEQENLWFCVLRSVPANFYATCPKIRTNDFATLLSLHLQYKYFGSTIFSKYLEVVCVLEAKAGDIAKAEKPGKMTYLWVEQVIFAIVFGVMHIFGHPGPYLAEWMAMSSLVKSASAHTLGFVEQVTVGHIENPIKKWLPSGASWVTGCSLAE